MTYLETVQVIENSDSLEYWNVVGNYLSITENGDFIFINTSYISEDYKYLSSFSFSFTNKKYILAAINDDRGVYIIS